MTGDMANIIGHEVEQIEIYLAHTKPEIIAITLITGIITALMFIVDWRLAFCLIVPVAVAMGLLVLLFVLWSGLLARYNQGNKGNGGKPYGIYRHTAGGQSVFQIGTQKRRAGFLHHKLCKGHAPDDPGRMQGMVMMILQTGVFLVIVFGIHLLSGGGIPVTRFVLG
ncbi:hypothetical protein Holit_00273 [Hollandina sp. SP2]